MSPSADYLLREVRALGLELIAIGTDGLRVRGPREHLRPELLAAMKMHKAELRRLVELDERHDGICRCCRVWRIGAERYVVTGPDDRPADPGAVLIARGRDCGCGEGGR